MHSSAKLQRKSQRCCCCIQCVWCTWDRCLLQMVLRSGWKKPNETILDQNLSRICQETASKTLYRRHAPTFCRTNLSGTFQTSQEDWKIKKKEIQRTKS